LNNVCAVTPICKFKKMYANPEPPPKWDVQDPAKMWEQFDDYLCYMNSVGKEMPISRIVVAVPNTTVVY
jgi:hypothetical protein